MTLSRKDQAKMKFLASSEGIFLSEAMARRDVPVSQVSDTMLPSDFKFEGVKVVYGKFCRTAGEYKAALEWGGKYL